LIVVWRGYAGQGGFDAVEPEVEVGHVRLGALADEVAGHGGREHADQNSRY
jgi:hypothetical protein